ncbi:type II toxin-antitoxin system VapC family toxin [Sphingomonas sp.]|uniref:type II toxin-antitoxin system VapC family toxin n=1 Tax=Sphingomonas sp. TaxID=28214 RepID=UPI002DD69235|nr:type II toxin-antitoxin system VapC family toxin [Sphingomonas sp.]
MIVDASVALKWLVVEDDTDSALQLLDQTDLIAPTLIHAEVANAIWKKRRLGELDEDGELAGLPLRLAVILQTIDETPFMSRALDIAMTIAHPVYDCVYLAVAEGVDRTLVTADRRFVTKLARHVLRDRVTLLGA